MKPKKHVDYLSSLRKEIAALSVVKCHMAHERVLRASDSMLPVVCRFPEGSYKRVGLCSTETRAQRLGCSHTMARIKLESAINELENPGEERIEAGASLGHELNLVNNEIHLLDHRKGEAEKAVARILEEGYGAADQTRQSERLRKAEGEIRDMEHLHDKYVDRIGLLRERVVNAMDRLIETERG